MNFQVFHVNPGKKLKKKDVNNDLSHFMSVFPNMYVSKLLYKNIYTAFIHFEDFYYLLYALF